MHNKLYVRGQVSLQGEVVISGAKNAALPIIAATLLTDQNVVLYNIPQITDVEHMAELLSSLGTIVHNCKDRYVFNSHHLHHFTLLQDYVGRIRASVLLLGPLLTRFKKVKLALPGGCNIGHRPIDMHIHALRKMGAEITLQNNYISAKAPQGLIGCTINFSRSSVGATENVLLAATLAKGTTIINNAACEPEITDLARFLNKMGAKISGIKTNTLLIQGVDKLSGCCYKIIPDRIEVMTFALGAVITRGKLLLKNLDIEHIEHGLKVLTYLGSTINILNRTALEISMQNDDISSIHIDTQPYPLFPSDVQAQLMSALCLACGVSSITENIYPERFTHARELCKMGAEVTINGNTAVIKGKKRIFGTKLSASDLRASAALLLAALGAKGDTIIDNVQIDRGYERIDTKLQKCNAIVERICH